MSPTKRGPGGDEVRFVDTTLRDGHASLWAEGMTTAMMLSVAGEMAQAGFVAMEVIATSHFKKCVRELREDPWERIRRLAERMPDVMLASMNGSNAPNTFGIAPLSLIELWLRRLAANGIRRLHMMEPSNDMQGRAGQTAAFAQAAGLEVVMALVYTLSPRHTDAYYAEKAADAVRLGVDVLYLKDPGGLLTPERVRTLVPAILARAGQTPLELHSHCTTGLAPLCYLEGLGAGIRTLHTAVPPLANGASQPSLFNVVRNARVLGFEPRVDEAAVATASERLSETARQAGLPIGAPLEYDHSQFVHQVPGGVISNLRHQLQQMGLLDRLPDVLREAVEVRRELGYPIMVTPFSQFVVSQAALHVLRGRRYADVTDELIKYALGFWGEEASSGIDPEVRERILSRPRAEELARAGQREPSLADVRQRLGGPGVSDDELLLRYIMGGRAEIDRMRAEPRLPEAWEATPLVALLRGLGAQQGVSRVSVRKPGFELGLRRRDPETGAEQS